MLTAAATATSRIAVGSHVLNVMNRHPSLLARMAATLQQLSDGRLVLGLGIGGNPADGRPFGFADPGVSERVARLEEAVAVMRALWTGETIVRPSAFYPLAGGRARPAPDPPPPIVIGGQSSAGARLAARIGDGWTTRPDLLERLSPIFAESLALAGRDRHAVSVLVGWEGGRAGQDALRASPWVDAPRETLAEWQARGADGIVLTARTTADVDALVRAAERW